MQEYKQQNKTYRCSRECELRRSIVFCGVNGVGKSTSLSKVAYYFKSKGLRVLLAACDNLPLGRRGAATACTWTAWV